MNAVSEIRHFHSFRKCHSRWRLQPLDCVIFSFVKQLYIAIELCQWTRVHDMAHSLLLATVTCRWFGKVPFVKKCMAWALICLKTVQQRPWLTREIETRLPVSRASYSGVVDHSSWRPVLSPLRSCVDRCHVWPNWASGGKPRRWLFEHQHRDQFGRASMIWWSDGLGLPSPGAYR